MRQVGCGDATNDIYECNAYNKVQVWINIVKKELVEDVGTGIDVALKLIAIAVCVKVRKHNECNGREPIIVGIDVGQPTIPTQLLCVQNHDK